MTLAAFLLFGALVAAVCYRMTAPKPLADSWAIRVDDAVPVRLDSAERDHWFYARSRVLAGRERIRLLIVVLVLAAFLAFAMALPSQTFAVGSYPSGWFERTNGRLWPINDPYWPPSPDAYCASNDTINCP